MLPAVDALGAGLRLNMLGPLDRTFDLHLSSAAMSATLPFSDLWGYLVWLAGFVLLSAGAGFALAGIWLAGQDRLTRVGQRESR